jgi:hypothetical protein
MIYDRAQAKASYNISSDTHNTEQQKGEQTNLAKAGSTGCLMPASHEAPGESEVGD